MKKKLIRLTEGDVHNMIRETVHRILSEQGDSIYDEIFDKYALDYDNALENSENIEDFDKAMKLRDDFAKAGGKLAQHYHPQTEPLGKWKGGPHGSVNSFAYTHDPNIDLERDRQSQKWRHGF